MLSLHRPDHVFVGAATVGAGLLGLWAIAEYLLTQDSGILAIGLTSILIGGGLLMFDLWGVTSVDRSWNQVRRRMGDLIHGPFHRRW